MYWSGPERVAFGCREQVCSYDVLIGEKLDAIAKSVHMYYQRFYGVDGDVHTLWRKAGVYDKNVKQGAGITYPVEG